LKNKYVFGIFFILYTLLITSTMMKVLINILHAIFEKATHVYENERLRTKCILILSNESIFGRESLFKDCKYVFRFTDEDVVRKASHGGGAGHGGAEEHGGGDSHHENSAENVHHGSKHAKRVELEEEEHER
jgi:hypothetical protein